EAHRKVERAWVAHELRGVLVDEGEKMGHAGLRSSFGGVLEEGFVKVDAGDSAPVGAREQYCGSSRASAQVKNVRLAGDPESCTELDDLVRARRVHHFVMTEGDLPSRD